MTKLFNITTTVPEFEGFKNVVLQWVVWGRSQHLELPYADLIKDYDTIEPDADYVNPVGAINEMFTEAEMQAWLAYLKQADDALDATTVHEARLPIEPNTMPVSDTPFGGKVGMLMIWKRDGYPLPFEVGGYYDLRHHERA